MLLIETKRKIEVMVSDESGYEHTFYHGNCELEAEKFEACLDMVVEIARAFNNPSVDDVQTVWEILEVNAHTP